MTVDTSLSNSGITIENAAANYEWKLLTDDDLRRNIFAISNIDWDPNKFKKCERYN